MKPLALMIVVWASTALGVEPSGTPIPEAVRRGELAFIGRIVSAKEIRRSGDAVSEVEMSVAVSHCFHGDRCMKSSRLRLRYWSSSDEDSVVPASFEVGARYLWGLRKADRRSVLAFDTTWADGWTDMAYVIRSGVGALSDSEAYTMTNIWSVGAPRSVSVRELRAWASERDVHPK